MIMGFTKKDNRRNKFMLHGGLAQKGYDWWWHSFTGISRKDNSERQFFVEYFLINPALGGDKPVFGQLPGNKENGIRPSYLMVKAGAWGKDAHQLHRFFPWSEVSVSSDDELLLSAGDCLLRDDRIEGSVNVSDEQAKDHPEYMCDGGSMSWELSIEKVVPYNVGYGTSELFRELEAFEMYWHASGIKSRYSGTVQYNGEYYDVIPERSFGYADKNWGSNFTSPWVWLSSCRIFSIKQNRYLEDTVFDIGGGCPRVFGVPLQRKLLSAMYYEGREMEFNFSKFWTFTTTAFNCHETDEEIIWHVRQGNLWYEMITDIRCRKEDMLLVNYEAPDGTKRHNKLFNGGNGKGRILLYKKDFFGNKLIDVLNVSSVGCEYGEFDT